MKEYVDQQDEKANIQLNQELLLWTAYVMGKPTNLFAMGEEATINQPMQTVAPRTEAIEAPEHPKEGAQQAMKTGLPTILKTEISQNNNVEESTEENIPNGSPTKDGRKETPPEAVTNTAPDVSPTRRSPRKTPNGVVPTIVTSRPRSESPSDSYGSSSQPTPSNAIPPTRFEVFPPLKGAKKPETRRAGRPSRGGGRRTHHASPYRTTPARRSSARRSTPTTRESNGREALRRTRSRLAESVAADDEDAKPEEADDRNEIAVEDDDLEMLDANGDEDEDAPGSDDEEIRYE
jgi:histone acetyltransferase SAS3